MMSTLNATVPSVSITTEGGSEPPTEITDAALALSWFYGDLVHADQEQAAAGERFGIDLRYAAAAVRTAQLTILTRDTLNFMLYLEEEGALPLSEKTTAAEVTVANQTREMSGLYVGPTGADPFAPGTDPGEDWERIDHHDADAPNERLRVTIPWGNGSEWRP